MQLLNDIFFKLDKLEYLFFLIPMLCTLYMYVYVQIYWLNCVLVVSLIFNILLS